MKTPTLILALVAILACAGLTACASMSGAAGSISYDPDRGFTIGGTLPPTKGYSK